jgi:hypothetical protein
LRVFAAKNFVTESSPPLTICARPSTLIDFTAETSSASPPAPPPRRPVHRRDEVVDLLLLAGELGDLGRVLHDARAAES